MDSRETGLNNNVIVCGTSGCGKTMSVSEPLTTTRYDVGKDACCRKVEFRSL